MYVNSASELVCCSHQVVTVLGSPVGDVALSAEEETRITVKFKLIV